GESKQLLAPLEASLMIVSDLGDDVTIGLVIDHHTLDFKSSHRGPQSVSTLRATQDLNDVVPRPPVEPGKGYPKGPKARERRRCQAYPPDVQSQSEHQEHCPSNHPGQ